MKVLVTGASGFIGLHLCKKLRSLNYEVYALVRDLNKTAELESYGCHIILGDLLFPLELKKHFRPYDVVFNLAGFMTAKKSEHQKLFEVNDVGTKNLVELCIESKVRRIVHVSSCVTFGSNTDKTNPLITETRCGSSDNSQHANVQSKIRSEHHVLNAVKSNLIEGIILNPSLVYGAGDALKEMRKSNITAARGKLGFVTEGGVSVVGVHAVVDAMINSISKGKNGERYLLTGDNITISQLFEAITKAASAKPPKRILKKALLDKLVKLNSLFHFSEQLTTENIVSATTFFWYDHQKATADLDFSPDDYLSCIKESVDWMKAKGII